MSISFHEGFKILSQLTVAGPDAVAKAKLCADIVFERAAMDGAEFKAEERFVEIVGTNACHAGIAAAPDEPAEVVLRIGARGQQGLHACQLRTPGGDHQGRDVGLLEDRPLGDRHLPRGALTRPGRLERSDRLGRFGPRRGGGLKSVWSLTGRTP